MPSLRLIQAPVFHGHSFSIWVEFEENPGAEELASSLSEAGIDVRPDDPPSNAGIAGVSGLSVGAIVRDPNQARACWLCGWSRTICVFRPKTRSPWRGGGYVRGGVSASARAISIAISIGMVLSSCGYHVAGKADLLPKSLQTVCIPAFANSTIRYKLTDHLAEALSREFIARTRYHIVADPNRADAVLKGNRAELRIVPDSVRSANWPCERGGRAGVSADHTDGTRHGQGSVHAALL